MNGPTLLRRPLAPLACGLFLLRLLLPGPAGACSVCRCGDPTFNALGTQIFDRGVLRLALDFERLEKSQGGGEAKEELVESRWVATLSYAPIERLQLVARLPWSQRELSGEEGRVSARGLADPELYALVRLWSSGLVPGLGRRSWVSLVAGVKTDWGDNDLERDGERLDEHAQSGTGARDPFLGLSAVRLLDPKSTLYGSLQGRFPGRNRHGYRYGDALLANLGYERKPTARLDTSFELNFRDAERDQVDRSRARDPDTGGRILYASPRLLVDLGHGVVARLALQVPVWKDLDGAQDEKRVVDLGLTLTF
jgi:hypothetical protein